jgi:hypothetical protein
MNGIVGRRLRKQAFEETGDSPVNAEKQQYKMHCPGSKLGLMQQGKYWGTLVTVGGRHLYRLLKKKYREDRRDGRI